MKPLLKVAFHTLGCKVNQYETEAIKEAFVLHGAEIVSDDEPADVYIVNTCTVTNIADRKSRQQIRRMKALNPGSLMVATGCYVQVEPEAVASIPEVDMIIGNNLKSEIADRVFDALEIRKKTMPSRIVTNPCSESSHAETDPGSGPPHTAGDSASERDLACREFVLPLSEQTEYEDLGRVNASESSMCRAYIKIEDGCNRYCSYCLIPYARGRVRSRSINDIVDEARELVASGHREIVLTGINTALYGSENSTVDAERESAANSSASTEAAKEKSRRPLEELIKRLDELEGDFRIRLSSLEPTVVDVDDVKRLLGYDKLCHHLHLSIQSGSEHVLRMMNRHYSVSEYLEIVAALKEFDPDYGVTTDIIAGFPGETEEDHRDSLKLIEKAGFGRVHVFRYSPRKGTKAYGMPEQVDGRTKSRRASELDSQAGIAAKAFIEQNARRTHRVLAEQIESIDGERYITGYTDNYIKAYIPIGHSADSETVGGQAAESAAGGIRAGEFCEVRLMDAFADGALAELILE